MQTTSKLGHLTAALALPCGLLFSSGTANATTGIMDLSQNTTLTENHYGTIRPNGYHVYCNGFGIYNGDQGADCNGQTCGINLGRSSHSKIFDCTIRYFDVGVYGSEGEAVEISGSTIEDNGTGVSLSWWQASPHTYTEDNSISYNSGRGIDLQYAVGQQILRNQIWYNGSHGLYMYYGYGSTHGEHLVDSNDFWQNGGKGLYCRYNDYVHVYHNTFEANGTRFTTKDDGILLWTCNNFDVWDNYIPGNGRIGLYVFDSDNGIVEGNNGHNNTMYDAYQYGSTGNTWLSNSWGKTYPSGLP